MTILEKKIKPGKKVYFVSDSHLGIPDYKSSLEREKLLVNWLDKISLDAGEIYFLGDIFDFWFEYKKVVPRGYVRLFGKIAALTDAGLPVYFFNGNHDLWTGHYFEEELGMKVYNEPLICRYNNSLFYIAHGDGIGPGDKGYKVLKSIFTNKMCKWLFSQIHPDLAFRTALFFSRRSRLSKGYAKLSKRGTQNDRLVQFATDFSKKHENINYFIFGHRHKPLDISLNKDTKYINTGDWFKHFSYVEFDGDNAYINYFLKPGK